MSKNFMRPRLLLLAALVSSITTAAWADTFTVTRTNNTGPGSLPVILISAIATPGSHTIEFSVAGTIGLVSPLPVITNNLTINGRGAVTISGGGVTRVFAFGTGSTGVLSGLTLCNANAGDGGAISNAGTLVVSDCVLTNNYASRGGGVFSSGPLTLINSLIVSNHASGGPGAGGGGAYCTNGLTVAGSSFIGNVATAGSDGGAVRCSGLLTVTGSAFSGNSADGSGGAVLAWDPAIVINSTFTNNSAPTLNGGALYCASSLSISNAVIHGNSAGNGGGIYCLGAFAGNTLIVTTNRALLGLGGGIFTSGSLIMERTAVAGNQALGSGGTSGSGGGGGGAGLGGGWFHTNGVAMVTNCTFSANSSVGGSGGAGSSSTFPGGSGGGNNPGVGGVYTDTLGTPGLTGGFGGGGGGGGRSALSLMGGAGGLPGFGGGAGGAGGGGAATGRAGGGGSGHGGAIFVANGLVTLMSCTVAYNSATAGNGFTNGLATGAGIYSYRTFGSSLFTLANTIIGSNSAATSSPDLVGDNFNSVGFNLIGNNQGASGLSINDYQNEPPNIGPLQDNGGGTFTHALLANSLAVGAGTSVGAPTTDQRGVIRPPGQVDIGAFQLVTKVVPQIAWATPAEIIYGAPLSTAQLNASAGAAGTYTYTPPVGTVLNAGSNQTLAVFFTPTDPINYLPNSNTVRINVRKADQIISFGPLANKQLGDAPFSLSATASSGLPVSFSLVSGPATVVGTAVTLAATQGLVTLRTSQAGNANYNAAMEVEQSFYLGSAPFPLVSQQPLSQTLNVGDRVVFSVSASGAPLSYQWQFKGTNLPGETGSSITLQRVNSGHTGPYNVLISNPYGTVVSTIATLNVNVPASAPAITSQPLNQTVTAGNAVTLSVTATGSGLTYQWHLGTSGNTNAPVPGATGAAYTTPALTTNVSYWVVVRNAFGLADSATASLSVQPVTGAATLGLNMLAGLTIDGTAGGAYRLEYTTNAVSTNWVALTNLTLLSPRHYFADWDSTNAVRRFYRVVVP